MRRSNRRTSRKAHQANNMAAENSELFWDIGNFKKTVKRVDDGAVVCDDILRMVNERAEIESKYAKKLTAWEEKWRKQIQNGPMYATMKNAFSGVLSEAQERAKIHVDCYGKLHNQIIESVKSWKTQTFHKHFMGYWKESKEVDDEFTKAQKPWAEGYNKVQRAKRNYHGACKNLETASQGLSAAKTDENFAPEKVKKLEDNVNKQENNVARTKKKYQEKLRRLEPLTISYEAEMKKVFDKCQHMEEKKLKFFQDMLVEYHKCVNVSADERLAKTFKDQLESAKSGDVKHDLIWWAENYGADMPKNWPRFEEPGEVEAPVFSENDIGDKTTEVESTYQVPRRQDSNPPSFVPYNGGGNPFSSVSSETGGRSDDEWDEPPPPPDDIPGVPVRALYTYTAVEDDELSFKSGDVLTKLSEEDAQGWCRGRMNGKEGLYPANYVESV